MKIEVAFPECVHVELVQANDLKHYEIFMWLCALFASAAASFWVGFATVPFNKILFVTGLTFSMFMLVFGGFAYYYRAKISDTKLKRVLVMEDFKNVSK